jgi:hypothetical protein
MKKIKGLFFHLCLIVLVSSTCIYFNANAAVEVDDQILSTIKFWFNVPEVNGSPDLSVLSSLPYFNSSEISKSGEFLLFVVESNSSGVYGYFGKKAASSNQLLINFTNTLLWSYHTIEEWRT